MKATNYKVILSNKGTSTKEAIDNFVIMSRVYANIGITDYRDLKVMSQFHDLFLFRIYIKRCDKHQSRLYISI